MRKPRQNKGNKRKFYTKEDIFLSRMASILKMPQGVVLNMFSERTVTAIRLNNLVADPSEIRKALEDSGAILEEVPWSPHTFTVKNRDKSDLAETDLYKTGAFYIQNLSSMLPAIILNPDKDDVILDLCAAPGSKTTQLASMMENQGEIVANDADSRRVNKLRSVLELFKVTNAKVTNEHGGGLGKREQGHYDGILLDAPCSGEGLIYLKGEKPLRFWNIKKVKPMAKLQKDLIESAFQALKPGEAMVYSTCTLEPEENEGVVTYLLDKFKDAQVEEIDLFDSAEFEDYKDLVKRGIREWNDIFFSPEVSKTYRVLPSSLMMGFYLAKIRKAA